eukprot:333249-Prymnesium_polylepis.1
MREVGIPCNKQPKESGCSLACGCSVNDALNCARASHCPRAMYKWSIIGAQSPAPRTRCQKNTEDIELAPQVSDFTVGSCAHRTARRGVQGAFACCRFARRSPNKPVRSPGVEYHCCFEYRVCAQCWDSVVCVVCASTNPR